MQWTGPIHRDSCFHKHVILILMIFLKTILNDFQRRQQSVLSKTNKHIKKKPRKTPSWNVALWNHLVRFCCLSLDSTIKSGRLDDQGIHRLQWPGPKVLGKMRAWATIGVGADGVAIKWKCRYRVNLFLPPVIFVPFYSIYDIDPYD